METRIEINCTTGEVTEIPLTQAELDQRETDRIAYEMEQANKEVEQAAKADAKASAKTKLAVLGLTEEEIQAII